MSTPSPAAARPRGPAARPIAAGIVTALVGFTSSFAVVLTGLDAFGSAVQQAIDDPGERMPAVVTFLVAASGVALLGISAAFWALVAGLVVRAALHLGR